ncbi:MAG TPA: YncE family protein [Frankiaceae bacterium]|nr:YncE family protein [Frankiaceae bacterium]
MSRARGPRRTSLRLTAVLLGAALAAACSSAGGSSGNPHPSHSASGMPAAAPPPGAPTSATNVYAATNVGMFQPATQGVPYRLYVPNHSGGTISVIDPVAKKVIGTFRSGSGTQHVIPAWDLKTLYAANDEGGNSLTPIDPKTGKRAGSNIPVADPYNMYFTPDGAFAIVIAEAEKRLNFSDPHTFKVEDSVPVNCSGVNHVDFSADGRYFIATCEFSSQLVKVDTQTHKVLGYLTVPNGAMPQDIKINPSGTVWYVSDMHANGIWTVDGDQFRITGFIPTGPETHGLYPSRDATRLYISNRGGMEPGGDKGSVSVLDFVTNKIVATWPIAPPSTPDMGGVSPDGKTLWLSGRRNNEVYGIDTTTGQLVARIKVGAEPHGLAVWPQPGRYSLGHTGILR